MFYVLLVSQYLTVAQFDDETVQAIMEEALKYERPGRMCTGAIPPPLPFDCSGLVQWCYGKAGITLPRTAQEQYNVTQHIPLSEAKAGDLVFSIPPTMLEPTSPMWGCMWEITGCTMPEIPLVTQT